MTDNSRPPDWAVAKAFWVVLDETPPMYKPACIISPDEVINRARQIAEGVEGD